MEREKAIEILNALAWVQGGPDREEIITAISMAIEALSEERTGGWIDKGEYAECSMCGAHSGTQFNGVEPIPLKTNYCPNCGVKMKGGENE